MSTLRPGPPGGRTRVVLAGLGALVGAAVLIGLVTSYVGTQMIEVAGLATDEDNGDSPTSGPDPGPTPTESPEPTTESTPTESSTTTPVPGRLVASPQTAATFESVSLTGRLTGVGPGTTLQVQRREGGGWVDFPVTETTGAGGSFATVVELGQLGPNVMRLVEPGSGQATPSTTITVR